MGSGVDAYMRRDLTETGTATNEPSEVKVKTERVHASSEHNERGRPQGDGTRMVIVVERNVENSRAEEKIGIRDEKEAEVVIVRVAS